jgi:hypothetical protein
VSKAALHLTLVLTVRSKEIVGDVAEFSSELYSAFGYRDVLYFD